MIRQIWDSLKQDFNRSFCQHYSRAYSSPVLKWDENGNPYVASQSYCTDCGAGVPAPPEFEIEAARLLASTVQVRND